MKKILDIQTVNSKIGNNTVKLKRVIWILVDDETSRTYKTDAIRCSWIGAGFNTVGAYWLHKNYSRPKKLVSVPKKNPMVKVEKLVNLEHLERDAQRGLFSAYLSKKHAGYHVGEIIHDSNGDWAGTIRIHELGVDFHYYAINSKGPELKRGDIVECKIDTANHLLDHCGLCEVQSWKHLVDKNTNEKAV